MVQFIKKFMFRDHGTIMITSYYEKYYGIITITSRLTIVSRKAKKQLYATNE